jgi:hypothetical protein
VTSDRIMNTGEIDAEYIWYRSVLLGFKCW